MRVVLYERDGTLIGYHKEPAVPSGRTAEELAQDIEWFKQAFELPILTLEEVEAELAQQSPKQTNADQAKNAGRTRSRTGDGRARTPSLANSRSRVSPLGGIFPVTAQHHATRRPGRGGARGLQWLLFERSVRKLVGKL